MAESSPFETINASVARLRRRLRIRALIVAIGWILGSVSGLSILALMLMPTLLPDVWLRAVLAAVPLLAGVGIFHRIFWRVWTATRTDRAVAEYWEREDPTLGDGLIASVQFADEWDGEFRGSREAAEQLASWVEDRLSSQDVTELAPLSPARTPWLATAVVLVVSISSLWVWPDRLQSGWNIFVSGAQSHTAIDDRPLVGDVTLMVDAPTYSGIERRIIPNSDGRIKVLKGSQVTVTATTVDTASKAFLMVDDREIQATLEGGRKLTATFKVEGALDWRFGLLFGKAERRLEAQGRRIGLKADKPPIVTLDDPKTDQTLEHIVPFPVQFEIRDDFGITSANVVIALASDMERPVKIPQGGIKGKKFQGADEIDLLLIDAQAGDRVAIFVEAFDNNGVDGPQRGVSPTRFLTIRSPEADHYALTDSLHGLIELLIGVLANRLEVDIVESRQNGLVRRLNELRQQTQEAMGQVKTVIDKLQADSLTPDDIKKGALVRVTDLDGPMADENRFLDSLVGLVGPLNAVKISLATKHNEAIIAGTEKLIIYLEAIVSRIALEDIAMMTEELKASRERLRDLISAYKKNRSDALKDRILRNIQRLRDRMKQLQARMAKLRQKLPDEFLNIEGLKQGEVAKGLNQTRSQLDDIEKMLEDGKVDDALAALDQMSETLDQLSASLDKDMQKLQNDTDPELQRAISELMDRTRDLSQQQTEVNESTEGEAKTRDEAMKDMLNSQMAERIEKIKKDAEALRGLVEELARAQWPVFAEDTLNTLNQRVRRLVESLEQVRLPDALSTAEDALRNFRDLEHYARFAKKPGEQTRKVRAGVLLDQKIIKALAELLSEAQKQAQAANQQPKMDNLRQRQQQVSDATRKLQEELRKKGEQMPQLGGEPMQSLENARQSMERAGRDLRGGKPRHARAHQDEAMNQLQSVMKSLRQAGQPKPSGGRQSRRMQQQKVKIPGRDDHDAPEAFRKELMDAMKDRAPEQFEESVKRYYEELVK